MKKSRRKINYNTATQLRFLQSGNEFFSELVDVINNAQQLLFLQMYTLEPDRIGMTVIQALKAAAERGVKVYVLVDAYGSKLLTKKHLKEMQASGIHCRRFSPIVFLKLRAGRRLHHKIVVADGNKAIIGGINISDKYHGDERNLPWLDFGLQLSGPVAYDLLKLCGRMYYPDRIPASLRKVQTDLTDGDYPASVVHSDWFARKNTINHYFKQAIRYAEKDILIICSYFIPSFRLITLLRRASRRGIKIQLYLQGKSDIPVVRDATRFFYRFFFRHNMQIFEFPDRILHGKLWLVDNKTLSVGSFNFNHLSEYTSVETNVQVTHREFCKIVRLELQDIFDKYAEPVHGEAYLKDLSVLSRFRLWFSYSITTILMKLAFAFTSKSS